MTLGPKGRNVVLETKYGSPKIVNDGVTVAKEVELEDPVENIGAKLVRQVGLNNPDVVPSAHPLSNVAKLGMRQMCNFRLSAAFQPLLNVADLHFERALLLLKLHTICRTAAASSFGELNDRSNAY